MIFFVNNYKFNQIQTRFFVSYRQYDGFIFELCWNYDEIALFDTIKTCSLDTIK
jgi:hypothetical protein